MTAPPPPAPADADSLPPGAAVVIVGAGIAGSAAAAELCRARRDVRVTLVSREARVKAAVNVVRLTKYVESFHIAELDAASFAPANLTIIRASVAGLDLAGRRVLLKKGDEEGGGNDGAGGEQEEAKASADAPSLPFHRLIVATGASPRRLSPHPSVMVLRDSDSVARLASTLATARCVVVAGNGGIALGLAHALAGGGGGAPPSLRVVWAAKHGHVGDAFFDVDAAAFLGRYLGKKREAAGAEGGVLHAAGPAGAPAPLSAHAGVATSSTSPSSAPLPGGFGAAAGPGWVAALAAAGKAQEAGEEGVAAEASGRLETHLAATVSSVADPPAGSTFAARVTLSDGCTVDADVVISAIGVTPDTSWVPAEVARAPDSGLEVDSGMRSTSHPFLFAAGDAASVRRSDWGPHWFPMRLWSQARLTGGLAGAAVGGVPEVERPGGMGLELFAHATSFAGLPIVLLGAYNGQGLEEEEGEGVVTYAREEEGGDDGSCPPFFARVLLHRGRLAGCVLIGPGAVSLAGVFEDLILDGVDVGFLGARILDPELDLEAVFD